MPDPWEITWVNYYAVLGLLPDAEPEVIKNAYLTLAKKFMDVGTHPNVARMAKINSAYDILKNPELKRRYDLAYKARVSAARARSGSGKVEPDSPAPPKVYNSVLAVDRTSFDHTINENSEDTISFVVRHVSGELEPDWYLAISDLNGEFLRDAAFDLNPDRSFPTRVTIKVSGLPAGFYDGSFNVSVQSRGGL